MMTEHERQHMYTSGPCVSSERPAPGHIQCVPVSVQSALFVWIQTEKCLMHYNLETVGPSDCGVITIQIYVSERYTPPGYETTVVA